MVGRKKAPRKAMQKKPIGGADTSENLPQDLALLSQPLNIGVKNVLQILQIFDGGTGEMKDLLLNECNIIYECRACVSLFRSVANFLVHKRLSCSEHFCENMVIFDPNNGVDQSSNLIKQTVVDAEVCTEPVPVSQPQSKESEDIEPTTNIETQQSTAPISKTCNTDVAIPKKRVNSDSEVTETETKRKRLENIVGTLNTRSAKVSTKESLTVIDKVEANSQPQKSSVTVTVPVPNPLHPTNYSELEAAFSEEKWRVLRKEESKFNYECPACGSHISNLSNSTRHLVSKHHLARRKAQVMMFHSICQSRANRQTAAAEAQPSPSTETTEVPSRAASPQATNDDSGLAIDTELSDGSDSKLVSPTSVCDNHHHHHPSHKPDKQDEQQFDSDESNQQSESSPSSTPEDNSKFQNQLPQDRVRRTRKKKCFFDCNCTRHNKHLANVSPPQTMKDDHPIISTENSATITNTDHAISDNQHEPMLDSGNNGVLVTSVDTASNLEKLSVIKMGEDEDVPEDEDFPELVSPARVADHNTEPISGGSEPPLVDSSTNQLEVVYSPPHRHQLTDAKFDLTHKPGEGGDRLAAEVAKLTDYNNRRCGQCRQNNFESITGLQHHIVLKHFRQSVLCCSLCSGLYSAVSWDRMKRHFECAHQLPADQCQADVNVTVKHPPLVLLKKKYLSVTVPSEERQLEPQSSPPPEPTSGTSATTNGCHSIDDNNSSSALSSCSATSLGTNSTSVPTTKLITKLSIKSPDKVTCVSKPKKAKKSKKHPKSKKKVQSVENSTQSAQLKLHIYRADPQDEYHIAD